MACGGSEVHSQETCIGGEVGSHTVCLVRVEQRLAWHSVEQVLAFGKEENSVCTDQEALLAGDGRELKSRQATGEANCRGIAGVQVNGPVRLQQGYEKDEGDWRGDLIEP